MKTKLSQQLADLEASIAWPWRKTIAGPTPEESSIANALVNLHAQSLKACILFSMLRAEPTPETLRELYELTGFEILDSEEPPIHQVKAAHIEARKVLRRVNELNAEVFGIENPNLIDHGR